MCPRGLVKKIMFVCIAILSIAAKGGAGELPVAKDAAKAAEPAGAATQRQSGGVPERTMPADQQKLLQSTHVGEKSDKPVSPHKVNYFAINNVPGNKHAQVKFQISMKFSVLQPNLYVLKSNLFPAYIAYTQKSLWNAGRKSMPFEESNYNPEFFLDYPVNAAISSRFQLRNVIISPLEHESNGLAGTQSRTWNRQYVLVKFGYESKEKLEVTNSFLPDKAVMYVKLWLASGYFEQDAYLRSLGGDNTFLDYMGQGEIGVSVRNFLWEGSLKDHQLDLKMPVYTDKRKDSFECEFRQQVPKMNFAIYLQYWYGYGETLLRFDRFVRRGFAGLSYSY